MKINVTLSFNGNCNEALTFYSQVFKKEVSSIHKYSESPSDGGFEVSEADLDKVMHSELHVSPNLLIMAVDSIMAPVQEGNNVGLSINFEGESNLVEAQRVFNELSEGGQVIVPFAKQFWGATYGMLVDKFGISWEVNCQLDA